jgi:hypothetical protein
VIDPAANTIFVVAFEMPIKHFLVALDTQNGNVRFSVPGDPTGADPRVQQQRAALTLGNGKVYVPYGGLFGDCGDYHGWVVGFNPDGGGSPISYEVPSGREAGIWGPSGAVLDSHGNLFVATGNGASSSTFDHGNSVIELSPGLQELGYFAPANWRQLNQGDTDLGTEGPALVAPGELFQVGKEGVGYLLNSSNLGGIGGEIHSANVCSSSYGGTANAGGLVLVPCTDGLVALRVSQGSFQAAWQKSGFGAGPPIVTGNVVWVVDVSSGVLRGFDAGSGQDLYTFQLGAGTTRFTTPSIGDGRLFVATLYQVVSFQMA